MPFKAFRCRVYPTSRHIALLDAWSDALRFLWNLAHEQRLLGLARPRGERRYYSAFDQGRELTALRADLPWLASVPRNVSANLLAELDEAWRRWLSSLSGMPRWKSKGDHTACLEPHSRYWRLNGDQLHFPKLGPMRVVVHRPLEGKPKTCAIVRDGDQWFCVIVCEIESPAPADRHDPVVAIDRGVTNVIGDSDGRIIESPRFLKKQARRLAHAQRVVARRKKGSKNQKKAKARVMRLHRKVRRQRDHFLHVETSRYAKSHGTVIVERLEVRNMTRRGRGKRRLNRGILDAGWGRFVEMLRYKLAWSGGRLVEVPAAYSSQTCSACGHVAAASRRREYFGCVACGHHDHADSNAAKVLLSRGIHGGAVCGGSVEVRRPAKQKR